MKVAVFSSPPPWRKNLLPQGYHTIHIAFASIGQTMNTETLSYKSRKGWLRTLGVVELIFAVICWLLAIMFHYLPEEFPILTTLAGVIALWGVFLYTTSIYTIILRWESRILAIAGYGTALISTIICVISGTVGFLITEQLPFHSWGTILLFIGIAAFFWLPLWFHTGKNVTATLLARNPKARIRLNKAGTGLMLYGFMSILSAILHMTYSLKPQLGIATLTEHPALGYNLLLGIIGAVFIFGLSRRKSWGWFGMLSVISLNAVPLASHTIFRGKDGMALATRLTDALGLPAPNYPPSISELTTQYVFWFFGLTMLVITKKYFTHKETNNEHGRHDV